MSFELILTFAHYFRQLSLSNTSSTLIEGLRVSYFWTQFEAQILNNLKVHFVFELASLLWGLSWVLFLFITNNQKLKWLLLDSTSAFDWLPETDSKSTFESVNLLVVSESTSSVILRSIIFFIEYMAKFCADSCFEIPLTLSIFIINSFSSSFKFIRSKMCLLLKFKSK